MLDSKYNRFLWYYLTGLDSITNSEGRLVCEVPFGNYKVSEVPDDNFNSELKITHIAVFRKEIGILFFYF